MKALSMAAGVLLTMCCLPAFAQEAEPSTEPAPAAAPAPAPAPTPAPAPAPQWDLHQVAPPSAVYPQYDPVEMRRVERKMKRHERDVIRLERAMAVEGNDFSEEKYDRYRNQKAGGIALVAIGGVSLVTMVVYFFHVVVDDAREWSDRDYDNDDGQYDGYSSKEEQEDAENFGEHPQRVALWTMLITGIAGIAIGVPLLVTGSHGKKRQEMLQRKDEILAPFDPATASLSLFVDPRGDGGGLRLEVRF